MNKANPTAQSKFRRGQARRVLDHRRRARPWRDRPTRRLQTLLDKITPDPPRPPTPAPARASPSRPRTHLRPRPPRPSATRSRDDRGGGGAVVTFIADMGREEFCRPSQVGTHAQSCAEIEFPCARVPYMAGCDFFPVTMPRAAPLSQYPKRFRPAYGPHHASTQPLPSRSSTKSPAPRAHKLHSDHGRPVHRARFGIP